MKLLLIEDGSDATQLLRAYLAGLGHSVTIKTDVESILATKACPPDAVLMNISPCAAQHVKHIAWLRRSFPLMGIVIMANDLSPDDHVQTLSHGADYYLAYPLAFPVLGAVLCALERRLALNMPEDSNIKTWTLEVAHGLLHASSGFKLNLTSKECVVLATLIQSPRLPVSHEKLSQALGYADAIYDQHRIDSLLYRTRKKLANLPGRSVSIRNVYAQGSLLVSHPGVRCILG